MLKCSIVAVVGSVTRIIHNSIVVTIILRIHSGVRIGVMVMVKGMISNSTISLIRTYSFYPSPSNMQGGVC
jgi:hypothetical protein